MRMRRAAVCSKAYSRSRYSCFARPMPAARHGPRAANGAMCGSTRWPYGGFPIIESSRRTAAKSAAMSSASNAIEEPGPYLKIAIVHGRQVAPRDRLSLASQRPTHRVFPRGAHILHRAAIISPRRSTRAYLPFSAARLLSGCMRACTSAVPVASARRQRRGARQAWRSCCIAAVGGWSDRPLRYDVVTNTPGLLAFDASCCVARDARLSTCGTCSADFLCDSGENRGQWEGPILQKSGICH